jgi:hypothetical protein
MILSPNEVDDDLDAFSRSCAGNLPDTAVKRHNIRELSISN